MGGLAQEYTEPPEIEFAGDFFEIFGLPGPNFTAKVLQAKYYALMKIYHPDRNKGCPDAKKYNIISAKLGFIYEVLKDKAKLKRYLEDPTHEDFWFPGEGVSEDAGAQPSGAQPEPAKPVPSLGQLKVIYFAFSHFQSDDYCHRFRSDDYCRPARASPQTV